MNKLRLSLEDIAVESFVTLPQRASRGTVAGHDVSDTTCQQIICDCPTNGYEHTCNTCGNSCNGTCEASCNGTCGAGCGTPSAGGTCDFTCEHTCANTCDCWTRDCTIPPQLVCA